jgi:amino acid transporter
MKRTITVFGLISGLVLGIFLAIITITTAGSEHNSMAYSMYFGYAMMLAAFSVIFVAIKNYRDKHLDGHISFGKGFSIGLGITVIACVLYTITWMILLETVLPDFMDKYIAAELSQLQKAGKSAVEIQQHAAEMEGYRKMYSTWYGRALMTFIEPFPVGLLISAIAALVMMKRKPKNLQMA